MIAADDGCHPATDVTHVGGTLAEVVVVDSGEAVRVATRHGEDRPRSRRTGGDLIQRRIHDPWVPGEYGLGYEDGSDLFPGAQRRLFGELGELGCRRVERGMKAGSFSGRVSGRGRS